MKSILITFCLLFSISSFSQDSDAAKEAKAMELMSKEVGIVVDTSLFTEVTPNTYVSEDPKGVIMGMYVPETYENAKLKLTDNLPGEFKIEERGEKTLNGVKVLYLTGTSEAQGVKINSTVYCYKADEKTSIMLMGMIEIGADKKYTEAIDKALKSAIK